MRDGYFLLFGNITRFYTFSRNGRNSAEYTEGLKKVKTVITVEMSFWRSLIGS